MSNKQTAVEWLAEQMHHPEIYNPFIAHALEMERQQSDQLRTERDELMKALERICNCDESTDFGKAIDHCISTLNRMKEAGI